LGSVLHLPHAELLTEDTPLYQSGAFDSLGVLTLIDFLEREYDIEIELTDLVPENLASLRRLADLVLTRRKSTEMAINRESSRGTA
jgi:acyl carrier protein